MPAPHHSPPPADDTPGSDVQQIRALVAAWHRASQDGDTAAVLRLMSDDVVFLVPGRAPMGKAEFAALSAPSPTGARPVIHTRQVIRELQVAGDVAWLWSELEVDITPPGASQSQLRSGTTLTVFRKLQGRWLLARDANLLAPKPGHGATPRIPPGFNTVAPYFFADDAPALLRFLVDGLGGQEVLRHMDGERIANAQVRLGSSTVMVSQASAAYPAMPTSMYLYVADADAAMARALAAGARQVMAVADMPYQDRQGGVQDPCGNLWWLSQRLVDGPYD